MLNSLFKKQKEDIKYFLYEIVHHCNLNCNYCDHCSPIAKPEYVSIKQYKSDIIKMKKLFNNICKIGIMGGEPLLHKDLNKILKITREILPKTRMLLFTNGILLKEQDDKFWEIMSKTKTILLITRYGNTFNFEDIKKKISYNNIFFEFVDDTDIKEKVFIKTAFNLNGTEDIETSHNNCYHAKNCHQVENGFLYKCSIIPAARHFNEYFSTNMIISEKDMIDLDKKHSRKEILDYFNNPVPFCKYCNIAERSKNKQWNISSKTINEWT